MVSGEWAKAAFLLIVGNNLKFYYPNIFLPASIEELTTTILITGQFDNLESRDLQINSI